MISNDLLGYQDLCKRLHSDDQLAVTLMATISYIIILPISLLSTFLIEGLLGSKTYLAKVDESESAQKSRGRHLTKHCRQFRAPLWSFWILQSVQHCRQWVSAPALLREGLEWRQF